MDSKQWRDAWKLYERAYDAPDSERDQLLTAASNAQDVLKHVRAVLHRSDASEHADVLAPGYNLHQYELLETIGGGSSGQVYRAKDTILGRQVAIKLLNPTSLAFGCARERFVQEARAAAVLNHPNIVTVYEIVQQGDQIAIVMELVEGVSLRSLAGAARSISEVVKIGRQLADALSAAHQQGIIHRDLKPENILIRPDGLLKVVDFGLARMFSASPESPPHISGPSVPVGTFCYMSPEQARGEQLTPSSDIFALGIVLYELATGHRPFEFSQPLEVLHEIATRQPRKPSVLNAAVPPPLDRLLLSMLAKQPETRPTADRAAAELAALDTPAQSRRVNVNSPVWIIVCAALVLTISAAALLSTYTGRKNDSVRNTPLRIVPLTSLPGSERRPAFSPDGQSVAFVWDGGSAGNFNVYVSKIGEGRPLRVTTGSAPESDPAWSPDGRSLAFLRRRGGMLAANVVPSSGGFEQRIGDVYERAQQQTMLTWAPDGESLVITDSAPGGRAPLFSISVRSGQRRPVTSPPKRFTDINPAFSPDGHKLAFIRTDASRSYQVYVMAFPAGTPKRVYESSRDINSLAWSPEGGDLVLSLARDNGHDLWRMPSGGGPVERIPAAARDARNVAISPRAHRLAFVEYYSDSNIWRVPTHPG